MQNRTGRSSAKLILSMSATLFVALAPLTAAAQQMRRTSSDTTTNRAAGDTLHPERSVWSRTASPFAGWVIVPNSTDRAPVTTMSELLQGRVPGLSVRRTSGASGAASRIRLRGTRSAISSSTPLVIVDGLRVSAEAPRWTTFSSPGTTPGDEWTSPLDDLDPEDVERVEVLGGPAAAARYGTGATAGAIVITTRRRSGDGFHWAASSSVGTVEQRGAFPASFDQRGISASTGEHIDYCGPDLQAQHRCAALTDSLLSSNTFASHSPLRTGTLSRFGVNGSASSDLGSVYIATDLTRETGTVRTNDVHRRHILGHGVVRPLRSLSIGAHAGVTRSSLSGSDPGSESIFLSALTSGPDDPDGYDTPPETIAMLATSRSSTRFIFGGTATWEPATWLRVTGTLGEDRDSWVDDRNPPATGYGPDVTIWNRTSYFRHFETARAEASSSWQLGSSLHVTPSIGWEKRESKEDGKYTIINSYFSTTDPAAGSSFVRRFTVDALSGRVDLSWKDRIMLTGGARREKTRRIDDRETYPMYGASWRISAEPWFPRAGFIGELRLRATRGEAQQSRTRLDNTLYFLPPDAQVDTRVTQPSASETELGVDVEAWRHRIALSITHYHGRSDAWTTIQTFDPYNPFVRREGYIRSSGVEIGLSAELLETEPLTAGIDIAAAFPRTRYGGYAHAVSAWQRMVPGYPVAGYWAPSILGYTDLNQDQIISTEGCIYGEIPSRSTCEVTLGESSYLGPSEPTRELSLRPRVATGRLTLSALFDYRGGGKLFDYTEYLRCFELCRASQDARATLDDQARIAAARAGSVAGFIEDASFWKFRELALSYAAPAEWAAAVGASRLSLALAAHNLATWTRYRGIDPEVNSADYDSLESMDYFAQPQVRHLILRLDIGW